MNLKMNFIISIACVTCILLTICIPESSATRVVAETRETKPSRAMKLCGVDFIEIWEKICQLKKKTQKEKNARKRRGVAGK